MLKIREIFFFDTNFTGQNVTMKERRGRGETSAIGRNAMQKRIAVPLGLILMLFLSGCTLFSPGGPEETPGENLEIPKVYESLDEHLSLTATELWVEDPTLHEDSVLSLANEEYNSYLILLADEKATLPPTVDLDYYGELTGEATLQDLEEGEITPMKSLVLDGQPARSFYVKGLVDGVSITYGFVVFEDGTNFYQGIIWSASKNLENHREYYEKILYSITVNQP